MEEPSSKSLLHTLVRSQMERSRVLKLNDVYDASQKAFLIPLRSIALILKKTIRLINTAGMVLLIRALEVCLTKFR